ncbi:MAG TPA: metallophosphoesterase family protein [Actinomycetota bacterium]|nr:metallophosphoesterase family protein [Actinomycetota bacterium]
MVTIAHISDPHVGSPYFVPNLMNRVIVELNELEPDAVVVTGDFTTFGYRQEFKTAVAYLERIDAPVYSIPGNHDARNVGYVHFEELIGPRHWTQDVGGVRVVGVDSSEPDLDHGQIGRERYTWIKEQFDAPADLKVFALHHHLLPIPGTGRERNIVYDAGDLLEVLITSGVQVVVSGHKHVPYVWRLENIYVVNAGTCASLRLRGNTRPCYNLIEFESGEVKIYRKFPFGAANVIAHFSIETGAQYYRELEALVQEPRASAPMTAE